jgi:prophage tail gpP-like protein
MSGRDGAAVLVDCSAPIFVAKEVTLDQVVAQIVRPLGITSVRINAGEQARMEKVSIDPGTTAWDALQQAAEANGLWPWFEPDGTLVVGGPDYTADPVDELLMRLDGKGNNLLSLEYIRSMPQHFSEVTVLGQSHGTAHELGKASIKATAKDASVAIYRPHISVDGDVLTATEARSRARKYVADGRLAGTTLVAAVKGHRTIAGELWHPGQRVYLTSEPHGLDDIYFLMARKFSGGRGRPKVTQLTLKEDGVWVLDAHKQRKKAGKKKLVPTIVDWN